MKNSSNNHVSTYLLRNIPLATGFGEDPNNGTNYLKFTLKNGMNFITLSIHHDTSEVGTSGEWILSNQARELHREVLQGDGKAITTRIREYLLANLYLCPDPRFFDNEFHAR